MIDADIKRGDCFWCDFDNGTGSEQVGRRPVIVISNDKCNEHSPTITVVPITSENKKKLPTHAIVRVSGRTCVALCEQIFTVSKERLVAYINHCTENEMAWVEKCVKIQVGVAERRKTNFERINEMNEEQLAKFLAKANKEMQQIEWGVDYHCSGEQFVLEWLEKDFF